VDDVALFMVLFMKNAKLDFTGLLPRGGRGEEGNVWKGRGREGGKGEE